MLYLFYFAPINSQESQSRKLQGNYNTSHALHVVPRGPRDGELVNKRRATVAHVMVNECPNG